MPDLGDPACARCGALLPGPFVVEPAGDILCLGCNESVEDLHALRDEGDAIASADTWPAPAMGASS